MNTRTNLTRILVLVLIAALLAGCAATPQPDTTVPDTTVPDATVADTTTPDTTVPADAIPYAIGIIQLVEHAALDAARDGFIAALADNGYVDGEKIVLDYQNAQGDMNNLSTIADRFVGQEKDLVLAITTDAAQAMAGKTTSIPILGTAITSYAGAGLVDDENAPGGNISGTSDMNPVAAQISLIQELVPAVQTIGLAYNSSEDNSVLQAELAKKAITELGLAWTEVTVTSINDVQQALSSLVGKCEALYIPTDNTLASAMPTVHSITGPAKLPVVCGESNMTLEGGLATMGINYHTLGYQTGMMALALIHGEEVGSMPVQYAQSSDEVIINALVAREIGFVIPEQYADVAVEPAA